MKAKEDEEKTPDVAIAAKAGEQFGLISRVQALELGLSSSGVHRRLQSERWLTVRPGVYRFPATAPSWKQSLMAVCLQVPGAVAYGKTAGWLHGLEGLGKNAPARLEIAVDRTRNPRCKDVTVYRVRSLKGQWTHRDGIPVTHLPKTLIVLAGMLPLKDAEHALDSAARWKPGVLPWVTKELARYPKTASGGVRVMHDLLELRRSPTDSHLELELEQFLRDEKIPEPTYRSPVYDQDGKIGSIDFIWTDERVVLQTHGWQWHGLRDRWQVDLSQRRRLSVDGWRIIEVTSEDMRLNRAEIGSLLRRALKDPAAFSSAQREQTQPDWA